jgi:hypothetical protein
MIVKSPVKGPGGLRYENAENAEPFKQCDTALGKCDSTSSSTVDNGFGKMATSQSTSIETGTTQTNSGERLVC